MAANSHSLDLENTSNQRAEVDISDTDGVNKMTVCCWIKPESLATSNNTIASQTPTTGTDNKWLWRVASANSDEQIMFISASTGDFSNSATTDNFDIATGVWKFVAWVYDGTLAAANRIKAFQGDASTTVAEESVTISGTIPTSLTTPTDKAFCLGGRADNTTEDYDGLIDEFRLYSGSALTASQLDDIKDSDSTSLHAAVTGYWKLNNDYTDSSGNGYDLTAIGSPVFSTDVPFANYAAPTGIASMRSLIGVGQGTR